MFICGRFGLIERYDGTETDSDMPALIITKLLEIEIYSDCILRM